MRFIIKIEGWYLGWSTVSDSYSTPAMTLDELRTYYAEEFGRRGAEVLPDRLARVEETGTSARDGTTLRDMVYLNRAGDDEANIPVAEILGRALSERADWGLHGL